MDTPIVFKKLSIIIPVYNEETTVDEVLRRVKTVELSPEIAREVIVVNDGSTDGSESRILDFAKSNPDLQIIYVRHYENLGKGKAVQSGIGKVTGDYILIQDADLEYHPKEINLLMEPILNGQADVVYGSRFSGGQAHRTLLFWHFVGNRFLTLISNILTDLNLTDMETCYKLFPAQIARNLRLKEKRFGFEPEITAKLSKIRGIRFYEVGISYYGRTYTEGKKIKWKDGFHALLCIINYNLFARSN